LSIYEQEVISRKKVKVRAKTQGEAPALSFSLLKVNFDEI
jgi:hypothetical protein